MRKRPASGGQLGLGLIGLALIASVTAAAPAEARREGRARILSPGPTALVTGSSLRVAFVTRAGTRFTARLDGRRIKVRRLRGRRYVLIVRRSRLRRGEHVFSVAYRGRRGRTLTTSTRFVVPGRRARLVSVGAPSPPRADSPLGVRLRARTTRMRWRAWLNGHRLGHLIGAPTRHGRHLSLSASDGLRYGRNRLRVQGFIPDGRFADVTRTVRVPRRRPLAGAGKDRKTFMRRTVRLDGRASRPARAGNRLRYRWRIVRAPRRSRARLRGVRRARPTLRLDRPGRFRVRLTVTEVGRRRAAAVGAAGRSASDEVVLDSNPQVPPLGVPVDFLQGIALAAVDDQAGNLAYPGLSEPATPGNYTVVAIDRGDLSTIDSAQVPVGQESQLEQKVSGYGSNALVLLRGPGGSTSDAGDLNTALGMIGAETLSAPNGVVPQFAVVGTFGSQPGAAYQQVGVAPNVQGYVTRDSAAVSAAQTGYTFAPSEYYPFTVSQQGVLTVGCTTMLTSNQCTQTLPAGGAVNLFVLDATSSEVEGPELVSQSAYNSIAGADAQQLASDLASVDGDPTKLVILTANGARGDVLQPQDTNWNLVAQEVRKLGGNLHTFNTFNPYNASAPTASYALASGAGMQPQESVGGSSQNPLTFTGLLTRNSSWQLSPMVSAPLPVFDMTLSQIAYQQPAQDFPLTGGDYTALEAYIAENIAATENCDACGPGVRPAYWQTFDIDPQFSWSDSKDDLTNLGPPAGATPTQIQEFGQLKAQLQNEFDAVDDVNTLLADVYSPFTTGSNGEIVSVSQIATDIEDVLPANGSTVTQILSSIEDILNIASSAAGFAKAGQRAAQQPNTISKQVGGGLGAVANAFGLISVWTTDGDGNPLLEKIQTDANNLEGELANSLGPAAEFGLDRLGEVLVSDFGKLTAAQNLAAEISWSPANQQPQVAVENMSLATRQIIWNGLLPQAAGAKCGPPTSFPHGPSGMNIVTQFQTGRSGVEPVELSVFSNLDASVYSKFFAAPLFNGSTQDVGVGTSYPPQDFWLGRALKPGVEFCTPPLTRGG